MPNELERFAAWKTKFSQYEESGLLDFISDVAFWITYSSLRPATQESLSAESTRYLSDHFGINLSSRPSLIDFLTQSFLTEVKEWDSEQLRKRIPNPTTIELSLLNSLFSVKELKPNINGMTKSLYSLIDREALQERFGPELEVVQREDEAILNQISFGFGAPLYLAIDLEQDEDRKSSLRNNAKLLLHEMSRHETDSTQIINTLLTNPANINASLTEFFDKLQKEILARGELEISSEVLKESCDFVRDLYVSHYQDFPIFSVFKPRYNENLSQEEIDLLRDESEMSPAKMALMRKATNGNSDNIFKLSRALFRACSKQDTLPETAELVEQSMFAKFASELLKKHYGLEGRGTYFSSNPKMDEPLGFLMESFIGFTSCQMQEVEESLDKLRPEIKSLKTTREISDAAREYMDSGVHTKILKMANEYLKPLQEEIAKTLPTATAMFCNSSTSIVSFSLVGGLDQIVAKAHGIAKGFADKYSEIDQELTEAEQKIRDALLASERELKQIHEEAQKTKSAARSAKQDHSISFKGNGLANGKITELTTFESKGSFADEVYNQGEYKVYVTDEISRLLSSSDSRIKDAALVALRSGFLHAKSAGDTGIKPMNHGEKVNGHVITEVKLTGNTKIDNFLGVSSTGLGDIRLCGALKDGALLITHASLHGKGYQELFDTAEKIRTSLSNGDISIQSNLSSSPVPRGATSVVGAQTKAMGCK